MSITGAMLSMSEEQTRKRADELEDRIARLEMIVERIADMLTSEPALVRHYNQIIYEHTKQHEARK